jgi:AcrR family transcriptional regulator
MRDTTSTGRPRNRRGEGRLLRAEIVAAAAGILAREGGEEAVTLRSVAREIGIAAPSIYAHFDDRQAIIDAVVDEAFAELHRRVTSYDRSPDPVHNLVAGCMGYVRFALEQPATYRILFGLAPTTPVDAETAGRRTAGFTALVDALTVCVAAGRSTSTEPFSDSADIWSALHGTATLRTSRPSFPWPPLERSVRQLVQRLGLIVIG